MRVKAVITYDGSHYLGFQEQTSTKKTIMYVLNTALKDLHIYSKVVGSGRTDAGVHASGQVIHFDLPEYWKNLEKLKQTLNRKLTHVQFKHITTVRPEFHARFSAKKRLYRYVFKTSKPSVFEQTYVSYYPPFDAARLSNILKIFEGEHDFNYFRKTGSQTYTTIRTLYRAYYYQKNGYHFIYFQANGFLRSQVRMLVDTAMKYAHHELTLMQIKEQLHAIQKHNTRLAPPEGLYLARILY